MTIKHNTALSQSER